jgi:hypothetical protein
MLHCVGPIIALMTEAVSTSETSVGFYQTTEHNIPEDSHLLQSFSSQFVFLLAPLSIVFSSVIATVAVCG